MAKVQVGLLGTARGMQRELEKIADRADTDSPTGLHYVLQGDWWFWLLTVHVCCIRSHCLC